jgi:hypothetical protein
METFMTAWSSTMRNCAAASAASVPHRAITRTSSP